MTRNERARAVLAQRRHRLRKRYAALAVALAVPAMAGATDWGTSAPAATPLHHAAASLTPAASLATLPAVAGDADGSIAGQATSPFVARAFFSSGSWLDRARAYESGSGPRTYDAPTEPDDVQRAGAPAGI
jgi:hypothetical protein